VSQVRDILDGTEHQPRDVPADMTNAQMPLHVQRRANQKGHSQ